MAQEEHDFYIIYNKCTLKTSRTKDQTTSHDFKDFIVGKLRDEGITKEFKDTPGRNVFTQLKDATDNSRRTIVLITNGFVADVWATYKHQNAFKKFLDKKDSHKLVPISLAVDKDSLPEELNIQEMIYFEADYLCHDNIDELDALFRVSIYLPIMSNPCWRHLGSSS